MGSPCSPRDSQESSPTPQFKYINYLGSAFFKVQLAHPYMTTGKTLALTRQTFVGKVMSLLFNMLSRLVITLFSPFVFLKAMTNLESILKSRDITLPTEVHLVKAMVFPVVMYGCELDCEES